MRVPCMPPFARPPIPFAGKQAGGVPPLGLGAPPGSLAPLAHTQGRGGLLLCLRGLPFACRPCTHPPRGLFQVYASPVALRAMRRGGGAASG